MTKGVISFNGAKKSPVIPNSIQVCGVNRFTRSDVLATRWQLTYKLAANQIKIAPEGEEVFVKSHIFSPANSKE